LIRPSVVESVREAAADPERLVDRSACLPA
jgi:hypothetical protein